MKSKVLIVIIAGLILLSGCSEDSGYRDEAKVWVEKGTCPKEYNIIEQENGRLRCTVFKETRTMPICIIDVNCFVHKDIEVSCPEACVRMFR